MSFRKGRAILEGKPWREPPQRPAPVQAASPLRAAPAVSTFPAAARPPVVVSKPGGRSGAVLVAVYLFVFFSRILDLSPAMQALHIPMALLTILMIMVTASGKLLHAFDTKIARAEVLLVLWICVAFLFSSWHSGGAETLRLVLQALLLFIAIAVLVQDMEGWMYAAWALALSAVVSSLLSFSSTRVLQAGRFSMSTGTLADPNEYAMILLLTAPFWWLIAVNGKHPRLMSAAAILFNVPVVVAFFRTGSRGGLVGAAVLIGLVFWRARMTQKFVLVVAVAATMVCAFLTLPQYLRERFFTVFSNADMAQVSGETAEALRADIDSANTRKDLLLMSLQRTAEHPIFGVGPGVFEAANWDAAVKAGKRIGWQRSHNSYTQVSAELGIPGLILFLSLLWCSFRSLLTVARRVRKDPASHKLANAAGCLFIIMATFSVGAFFLSVAYSPMIAAMLGLSAALERITIREFEARRVSPSQALRMPAA